MPIIEGSAKLWHPTKEEQNAYDDQMIANIELKSLDYDDENFSPVFTRAKKEFYLTHSERYKKDINRYLGPLNQYSFDEAVDRYLNIKPNHTYYREWPYTKFVGSFGLGYLLLRELPIRNFYARCFIMYVFIAKFGDHLTSIIPFTGNIDIPLLVDPWIRQDIAGYHNVEQTSQVWDIPNSSNKIVEEKRWRSRIPAHLKYDDKTWIFHWLQRPFGIGANSFVAPWDGTFNQPLERLADPQHKDAHFYHWI